MPKCFSLNCCLKSSREQHLLLQPAPWPQVLWLSHMLHTQIAYLEDLHQPKALASGLVQGPSCEVKIESFHCCILVQSSFHECSQEEEEEHTIMSNTPNSFSISHQRLCPRTFLRSKSKLSTLSPDIAREEGLSQTRKLLKTWHQNQFTHFNSSTWLDAYKMRICF